MARNVKILMNSDGCKFYNGIFKEDDLGKKESVNIIDLKSLKNKTRLDIIVEGKELFIEDITFQRVGGQKVYQLVQCGLIQRFHSLNQIAFDYRVYKKEKDKIKVIIYCLNLGNLLLKDEGEFKDMTIKSVKVMQQIYAEFFIKAIKKSEFYALVTNYNYIYFFHVSKNIMIQNRVIELDFYDENQEILNLCSEINGSTERVYIYEKVYNEFLNKSLSKYENLKIIKVERYIKKKIISTNKIKVVQV